MLKNYFKTALRNLLKNKVYSLINITGLSIGIAVALLIGLWIWDELSFDHYHRNHKRLVQVMTSPEQETSASERVAIPLANELRVKHGRDFKNISLASRELEFLIAAGDKKIKRPGIAAEHKLPAMLTLEMVKGSQDALQDPSAVIISSSLATVLFGANDPIGKVVKLENKTDMKVTGVFKDLPRNSTFYPVKIFIPWDKYVTIDEEAKFNRTRWGNHNWQVFAELNNPADLDKISRRIKNIPMEHLGPTDGKEIIFLHPMDKWHLYNEFENGKAVGGQIRFVWLFGIIASFVLFLACINFINLTTARSEKRSKEVGIRKAIGSLRNQLVKQFLIESLLVTALAFTVSTILVRLVLPFFNKLSDKAIVMPWGNLWFWMTAIAFIALTGFVSGIYPAFYLSKFNPVKVLKGTFQVGRFAALPRKTLVVVQFTVSIVLVIATIVVLRQLEYGKDRTVGYDREGMLTIDMNTDELRNNYQAIRNDVLHTGVVENIAQSSSPSTDVWSNLIGFEWEGKDPTWIPSFATVAVSHDFGKTVSWNILAGRDFSRNFPTDTGAFILNEAAAKLVGFKNPIGKTIQWEGQNRPVIGVVKNMVMESPFSDIRPTVFFLEYGWARLITIRIKKGAAINDAISKIEAVFKQYNPGSPFEYNFTDDQYSKKFANEERIGQLALYFAVLTIFISCLGLFGLALFVAEQRVKEIGIRKVLGASVFSLWKMLSSEFVVLVIISCLIAVPIAWYFLQQWLRQYTYRTELSWWIMVGACGLALFITLVTVSMQAIKAAIANPVRSLRTE